MRKDSVSCYKIFLSICINGYKFYDEKHKKIAI